VTHQGGTFTLSHLRSSTGDDIHVRYEMSEDLKTFINLKEGVKGAGLAFQHPRLSRTPKSPPRESSSHQPGNAEPKLGRMAFAFFLRQESTHRARVRRSRAGAAKAQIFLSLCFQPPTDGRFFARQRGEAMLAGETNFDETNKLRQKTAGSLWIIRCFVFHGTFIPSLRAGLKVLPSAARPKPIPSNNHHPFSRFMKRTFLILALAFAFIAPAPADEVVIKKGIGLGGDPELVQKQVKALNVGWHYNWMAAWKGRDIKGVEYVPMIFKENEWTARALDSVKVPKSKMESSPLLGYNEPDAKAQGNMSVDDALELWPALEKTNRRLGSPATVHPDNAWMKAFMEGVEEKELRVDFICVHWYGELDAGKFIRRMEQVHKLYKKPIWITEFAIADWSAKSLKDNKHSPRDVLKFMKDVLPELEKLDFVERYAWFPGKPGDARLGNSALFDKDGELTKLGEFYANFNPDGARKKR
jgi:hypothetical protein